MPVPTRPVNKARGQLARRTGRRIADRLPIRHLAALGSLLLLVLVVAFAMSGGPTGWCAGKADAALNRADLAAAEQWLNRANVFDEDDAEVAFLRGRLSRKLGRHDRMVDHLQRAATLGYERAAVDRELRLAEAQSGVLADPGRALADLLVAGEDPREVCEAFVRGYILTYRLDEALRLLNVWEKDFPGDPQLHYLRGRILEHRADLDGAEREYAAALKAAPYHASGAYNLGRVLLAQQRPAAALEQYEACARHLPDPQPALVAAARCLRQLGRLDEAREFLTRAERSSSNRLEAAYCLVGEPLQTAHAEIDEEWGQLGLAEGNWAAAERRLRSALAANPKDWQVRYALATALRQQGETDEAAEHLQRFEATKEALAVCDGLIDDLRKDPTDADARYRIGTVFLEHVSEEQGLVWLRSALTYRPDHRDAHLALADYYARKAHESADATRLAERHRRLARSAETSP